VIESSYSHWDRSSSVDWTGLPDGATLTKFSATGPAGTHTVEIHGFVTEDGRLLITNEKTALLRQGEENEGRTP